MKIKTFFLFFLTTTILFISCKSDLNDLSKEIENASNLKLTSGILSISYDIKTTRDFEADFAQLSEIDLANVNPSEEKQNIKMNLLENEQLQISVTELPYEKAINIPHQILPDETPKTVRTEISGNTARFYDINGNLLGTESMPLPNYTEMVNELKKMGKNLNPVDVNNFISTFQGQPFLANLEEFIRNAPANGAQILTNNDNYVSFRTDYQKIDPRMHYSSVTLINKTMNKVVGIHYHDKEEKLIQAIYYVYNKGKEQFLDAIITEEMETLPSGKKVKVITTSKIENLNFDVNLD